MSLSSTINKVVHSGNGATTEWPFSFPVLEADHLAVILTDVSGVETTLSPTLYGIAGIGSPSGGAVTYPLSGSPIVANTKLTIIRTVPYTQTTVLSNQGGYYPEVVERRFDQIYMALQQLDERVSRYTLSSISNPATEQSNYALIQQLQQMKILTTQGDLLTRDGSAHKRLARGTSGQFLGVNGADLAWAIPSQPVAPQGRLTLSSGEPVMTADQTGKTSIFYTPYTGGFVPIYDGTAFVPTAFAERSNDLTQSATGKAGPLAAGPYQVIDAFVWNDSGTIRLTRGPKWIKAGAVTMTIAAPCVVTWAAHGLYDGATVRFTTTGALPTGLAANTDYFATKVDANTFKLSTTLANQVAGTFITTSGSQSGVHTGENYTTARGVGAATTEPERLNGLWVNKYDITNGPAARRGTYVGTIVTNSSPQVDFKFGGSASGGDEAIIGIWNSYNRVAVAGVVQNSVGSWFYSSTTRRAVLGSVTYRATAVCGALEEPFSARYDANFYTDGGVQAFAAVNFRTTSTNGQVESSSYTNSGTGSRPAYGSHIVTSFLGHGYLAAIESSNLLAGSYCQWFGAGASGLSYQWKF